MCELHDALQYFQSKQALKMNDIILVLHDGFFYWSEMSNALHSRDGKYASVVREPVLLTHGEAISLMSTRTGVGGGVPVCLSACLSAG